MRLAREGQQNSEIGTEIQKRGEQGQGMIFCKWNLLFRSPKGVTNYVPLFGSGLCSASRRDQDLISGFANNTSSVLPPTRK